MFARRLRGLNDSTGEVPPMDVQAITQDPVGVTQVRKLLNVLYVTSPDNYLARDGDNVVVRNDGVDAFRVPIINLVLA